MLQKLRVKEQFKNYRTYRRFNWNKIADKINSIGKPKEKEKAKEIEETYIPPEKKRQIIDQIVLSINFLCLCMKMGFQKIGNFLDRTSDDNDLPRVVTKNSRL